jgi:virulence-associated protein VapD
MDKLSEEYSDKNFFMAYADIEDALERHLNIKRD